MLVEKRSISGHYLISMSFHTAKDLSREREIFKRTTASKSGKLCLTLQSNLHIRREALISKRGETLE